MAEPDSIGVSFSDNLIDSLISTFLIGVNPNIVSFFQLLIFQYQY